MAKTKISEYSATNANNTDIQNINIAEGCAPSGINDAIRELMVHLKNFQTGASGDPLTVAGTFVASGSATINGTTIPASKTLADTDSAQTFTNKTISSGTITGGTINNATIGATTAAAATFTTVYASSSISDVAGKIRAIPSAGSAKTTGYTLATSDVGEFVEVGSGGGITIPNSTFAAGDAVSIFNNTSAGITITCSITTCYLAGTNEDKATLSLATRGIATVLFLDGTTAVVSGNVS